MGFDPQPRELWLQLQALNPRGRARTERALRRIYSQANEDLQTQTARFLYTWQSTRRFDVADDWMATCHLTGPFHWILVCYCLARGRDNYERVVKLFDRKDLSDGQIDTLIDQFGIYLYFARAARRRSALKIIASFYDHASPEVRWTTAFRLGTSRATEYRGLLVTLAGDSTKSGYGKVSVVAQQALKYLDGDETIDIGGEDEA